MVDFKQIKIDIVYCWVNDNDIEWRKKKDFYLAKECPDSQGSSGCRYVDNDELKYSLRSLEKFASWINRIFIITDNQIPEWLDLNNPKIKIIDHKEIIPNEFLPVFNSNAIEACIPNIQGLSEYFLYANDDCFFANYVTPKFFFHSNGYPYFRFSIRFKKDSSQYSQMCNNAIELIEKNFGRTVRMYNHHNINAFRKSDVKACISRFKSEFDATIASRFRENKNIEQTIHAYYGLAIKHGHYKGVPRLDRYFPIFKKKIFNYLLKRYKRDTIYFDAQDKNELEKFKTNDDIKLFCINNSDNENEEFIKNFLNNLFPEKSSFEK